jgi:small subunit ribosomal protein S4
MARYKEAVCRLCRREGSRLYLKGERCYSSKCAIEKRENPPGQVHMQRQRKVGDYGIQLRAKQKMRRTYGVLERPFHNYFGQAVRETGVTGENLLRLLELRLDNVVYRLGLAVSRAQARQFVRHRHVLLNGRIVNIPSYLVDEGDVIEIKQKSRNLDALRFAVEASTGRGVPAWLRMDTHALRGEVLNLPSREDIEADFEEQLVVEFYSR